ncbi:MAG: hypothetical protein ACYS21_10420, partial [Planctomycetota bacterium]
MTHKSLILVILGTLIFLLCSVSSADVPSMINYQGKLTTASGGCLNDTVEMTFSIYPDTTGSPADWTETQALVAVQNGIFNVLLGSVTPISASVFDGDIKYLGVQIEADPEMTPLKPMVTTAYAFHCATADSALNASAAGITSVDGVSNPGGDVDLIQTDAITIVPNDGANTITFGETHSARTDDPHTVTAAQTGALVSVDGVSNAGGDVDLVAGSNMTITPDDGANTVTFSSTGGGGGGGWVDDGTVVRLETSSDSVGIGTSSPTAKLEVSGDAFISGKATIGPFHTNSGSGGFVAGVENYATGTQAVIGGGNFNGASGSQPTVGGGYLNYANGDWTTVGGGSNNLAANVNATVGGGNYNKARGEYSVVSGGGGPTSSDSNSAWADYSAIGGGRGNAANGYGSTIGGGYYNTANATRATVGGGED